MNDPDLVFSLGPDCRTAWNVRNWFGVDRAYPFDWWITPSRAMLRMIEPGFDFFVARDHLAILPERDGSNSVYNYRLSILHHHDFSRRDGFVREISDEQIDALNAKYGALLRRLHDDLMSARRPLAVIGGTFAGWPGAGPDGTASDPSRNGDMPAETLIERVRALLGKKLRVLAIEEGERGLREVPGGTIVTLPDDGSRLGLAADQEYAEPVNIFRRAFRLAQFGRRIPPAFGQNAASCG